MIRWLKKFQNFKCVSSNLQGRLICGSFAKGSVVGTDPNDVDA
jgi:hypothetical protein